MYGPDIQGRGQSWRYKWESLYHELLGAEEIASQSVDRDKMKLKDGASGHTNSDTKQKRRQQWCLGEKKKTTQQSGK